MYNPIQKYHRSSSKYPNHFFTTQTLLLFLLLILAGWSCSEDMEETQKSDECLVVQMRKKLSLRDLDRKIRLNAVFFADKIPNKPAICNPIKTVLSRFGKIGVTASNERDLNDKMFSVTVEDEDAAMAILEGSPWSIMRYSVHFQKWPETLAIEELPCNQITFWVQIRGIPPYMFDVENVSEMVEKFGVFIKMDDPLESEEGTYSYLRVRIMLDARDPLPTGYHLPREDGSMKWVSFSYENISDFCFVCGRLGHSDSSRRPCPIGPDPDNPDNEYGEWMRAIPPRRQNRDGHTQIPASSQRTRRRFPGQAILPLQSQPMRQNLEPQGPSSSHVNAQSPHHTTPFVRQTFQFSDEDTHTTVGNQLDCNYPVLLGQSNLPINLPPANPTLSHLSGPPPGFSHLPINGPNVLDPHQRQSQINHNSFGSPEFPTHGANDAEKTHVLATLFSKSFPNISINSIAPLPTPTSSTTHHIPTQSPGTICENSNICSQGGQSKRPLQVDPPPVPKPRKIRKFTIRETARSGPSTPITENADNGSSTSQCVEGSGGWPTATSPQ